MGGWQEQADRALRRCAARGQPVSLLAVDADHFKQVNDSFGHAVGDQVLVALARTLEAHLRPGDLPGRIGGEEFAVLLPDCTLPDAARLGERLRAAVACAHAPPNAETHPSGEPGGHAAALPVPLTVSVGAAELAPGQGLAALLQRADTALYAAKTAGRDRVACAPSRTTPAPHLPAPSGAAETRQAPSQR